MEKYKILVVDDVAENIHAIINILKKDYSMIAATSGQKAIDIAHKEPQPDLILLDVIMPEMDGFDVCRILKESSQTKDIPIIYVTALNDDDFVNRVFDYEGVDYINKPIRRKELESRIKVYLEYYSTLRKLKEEV